MWSHCLMFRKNTESINPRVLETNNGKTMIAKYTICGWKKSKFIKEKEASEILIIWGPKKH